MIDLEELCTRERLDRDRHGKPAFDGPSMLLLSSEKLDLWERRRGHCRTDSVARIARIMKAAAPLRMPYAQISVDNKTGCSSEALHEEVPKELHLVERHEEHAKVLVDVLKWEVNHAISLSHTLMSCRLS